MPLAARLPVIACPIIAPHHGSEIPNGWAAQILVSRQFRLSQAPATAKKVHEDSERSRLPRLQRFESVTHYSVP